MDSRSVRLLSVLKQEFFASSLRGDCRYVQMILPRRAVLLPNGKLDATLLNKLETCARDGRDDTYSMEEYGVPDDEELCLSLGLEYGGRTSATYDRFAELAAGVMRCVHGVPKPKQKQDQGNQGDQGDQGEPELAESDEMTLAHCWTMMLLDWAREQTHPLLYASSMQMRYSFPVGDQELFQVGHCGLEIPQSDPERVARMKAVVAGGGRVLEVQCGLLRASVFGIERLMQQEAAF